MNCCVAFCPSVAVVGDIITGGRSVTVAVDDLLVSATLVARTVTVVCALTVAGAVYKPVLLIDPVVVGLIVHVTFVLAAPVTVAVNCCVWPCPRIAVVGATVTPTVGFSVTVALADLLVSATLVAVTVTVCCAVTLAGAVYKPLALTVPVPAGLIDHVTVAGLSPVTVAVNCCVAPCNRVAVAGEMVTGGFNVTVAVALFVLSATLVALTVTVCCVVTVAGAV